MKSVVTVCFLTVFFFPTATFTAICPAGQQSNGTCSNATGGENCSAGFVCWNNNCCPNCLHRLNQLTRTRLVLGVFIPQCDLTGFYLSEQCHYSVGQCWCVTELGEEIPNTRISTSVGQRGRRDCDQEQSKHNQTTSATHSNQTNIAQEAIKVMNQPMSTKRPGDCPLVKPGQFGTCLIRCAADEDCPVVGFKCCTNGCGRECKPAILQEPRENTNEEAKPGRCTRPRPEVTLPPGANGTCQSDSECLGTEKCCYNVVGQMYCTSDFVNDSSLSTTNIVTTPSIIDNTTQESLSITSDKSCNDSNTNWNDCGTACEETCQEKPQFCTKQCVPGCFCNAGYVRLSKDESANCIPAETCPASQKSENCSDSNASWSDCGTACEETCNEKPTVCTKQCVFGCFCNWGYVKESNETNAKCVLKTHCNQNESMSQPVQQQQQCEDPNSVWSDCQSPCEETCQVLIPENICKTLPCVSGCFCKPGYVRQLSEAKSKCVTKNECSAPVVQPASAQIEMQCPDPNSAYLNCGTACEETCQFRPTSCTKQCVQGCFCKMGYVKESNNSAAQCVAKDRCSQKVPPEPKPYPSDPCQDNNSIFYNCGPACQETCDYRPTVCYLPCISACFCKQGYVKENNLLTSKCIPKSQCGQSSIGSQRPRCPDPNASWTNCGTSCPQTCQQPSPQFCSMQCVPGCFCNDGYIKENNIPNARCVSRNTCNVQIQPTMQPQPQPSCLDPNSKWHSCGSACQESCQFRPTLCTLQCVSGCFCEDGFVKETNAQNARCVARSACSSSSNQFSTTKVGRCPPFTPNPYFGQPARYDQCRNDNECQSIAKCCNSLNGLVCMAPAGSEENQQCGNNQEYSPCPPSSECILTCDNFSRPSSSHCLVLRCGSPGCQCRAGYVLNTKEGRRECVPPNLCYSFG